MNDLRRTSLRVRVLAMSAVALIVAGFVAQVAEATSRETFYSRNNILFLETDDSLSSASGCDSLQASAAAGDSASGALSKGLMEIRDSAKFAQAIDDWIKAKFPQSPFVGLGKFAVMGGQRSGINPIFPIIIARKESGLGTAGSIVKRANNAYGRQASSSQPHILTANGGRYYKWTSLENSLFDQSSNQDDMYAYIKRRFKDFDTIEDTMIQYAPPSENDTTTYIREIKQWATEIYELAGDSINVGKVGEVVRYDDCNDPGAYVGGAAGAVSLDGFNMLYQHRGAWAKQPIGKGGCVNKDFTWCGCGPTSLAIVISNLTGNYSITPLETRDKASFSAVGINWSSLTGVPQQYGLKVQAIGTNVTKAREAIQKGALVIVSQSRGALTSTSDGHIFVLRAVTENGNFLVADPISEKHTTNKNGYSASQITGGTRNMWVVSK